MKTDWDKVAAEIEAQTAEICDVADGNALRVTGYIDERVNAGHEF